MLDAKNSSGMSEEGYATWLASFGLSSDRLQQCLELGQLVLHRRETDAAGQEEPFGRIMRERRDQMGLKAIRSEEKQWVRQGEVS